jgi:RNA recognition motif-containing protein
MKDIYVGNLDSKITEDELRKIFEPCGAVQQVTIPRDSETGQPRGFAYVEMQDEMDADDAIYELNGSLLRGRPLVVKAGQRIVGLQICEGCGKAKPVLYLVIETGMGLCEDCQDRAEEIYAAKKKSKARNS